MLLRTHVAHAFQFKVNLDAKCLDNNVKARHTGGLVVSWFLTQDLLFPNSTAVGEVFLNQPQRDPCLEQRLRKLIE